VAAFHSFGAYRKFTSLDPRNLTGWLELGDAAVSAGILAEAERAFRKYSSLSTETENDYEKSICYKRIGDVLVAQGDLSGAF
jgi:hypothetical protein